MSFHLQYPAAADFYTVEELGLLARCAGFNNDLFLKHAPQLQAETAAGLSLFDLELLLESRKLDKDLHRTMNWRSGIANAAVISTAARLLAERQLTFSSVYDARLAFDLYDHEQDHEGIFLKDLHNISRALKLCQRALGPVQLRSELRRITGSPVMPSRIQLHEFLHLLLSCAPLVTPTVHDAGSTEKDARDLYRLADFRKMLTPEDRQRQQTLDAQRHWKLARIKLNINATIVRDMVDRRNMPQTRVWDVEDAADGTHEAIVRRLAESQRLLHSSRQGHSLPADALAATSATLFPQGTRPTSTRGAHRRPVSAPVRRAVSASGHTRSGRPGAGRGRGGARRPQTATATAERAIDSAFVRDALAELSLSEADLHLRESTEPPIVADHAKLEHSALMQDLAWDLATGEDPALRKLMRDVARRPSTAPVHRRSTSAKGPDSDSFHASTAAHPWQSSSIGAYRSARPTASAPAAGRRRSSTLMGEAAARINQRQNTWTERTERGRGRLELATAAATAAERRLQKQHLRDEEERLRQLEEEELNSSDPRRALEAQTRLRRRRALSARSRTRGPADGREGGHGSGDEDRLPEAGSDDGSYASGEDGDRFYESAVDASTDAARVRQRRRPPGGSQQAASTNPNASSRQTAPSDARATRNEAQGGRSLALARRDWSAPGRWVVAQVGAADS